MKTRIVEIVSTKDFRARARFKNVRNVLLAGQEGKLNIIWPEGRKKGSWVVMDQLSQDFLERRVGNPDARIPNKLLFRGKSKEGKGLAGKKRLVETTNARKFLGLSPDEFLGVVGGLAQHIGIDGFQIFYAESVEKYAQKMGGGRR